jgi:hypothetical protein
MAPLIIHKYSITGTMSLQWTNSHSTQQWRDRGGGERCEVLLFPHCPWSPKGDEESFVDSRPKSFKPLTYIFGTASPKEQNINFARIEYNYFHCL